MSEETERKPTVQRRGLRRRAPARGLSYQTRMVEERILAAQQAGVFDSLPGKGKPLDLQDFSAVPQELRVSYHILKNANMLPPELELKKQILSLQDLLGVIGDEPKQHAIIKEIREKFIHMDILHRRSFGPRSLGYYGQKLLRKLRRG